MRQHLQTPVLKYIRKYPSGFEFDDKCGRKHIAVYKDYLTDEEVDERLENHLGYDSVWTYRWYMEHDRRDITRVYDILEG